MNEGVTKVVTIHCQTGCTCCSHENHYLGFYASKVDAERRVAAFAHPESKINPVASQYARKGRYSIEERDAEPISRGRIIVDDRVFDFKGFASVSDDGTSAEGETRVELGWS